MDFNTYQSVSKEKLEVLLIGLLEPEALGTALFVDESAVSQISEERLRWYETKGVICTVFTQEHPFGTYASDLLCGGSGCPGNPWFRFSRIPIRDFSILTMPAQPIEYNSLEPFAFGNRLTDSQVLSFYRQHSAGRSSWSKPMVFPDGSHIQPSLSASEQYAQSCFEGIVAYRSNDKIVLFRIQDHAVRFKRSCMALAIPGFDEQDFITAVELAVKANKRYWPQNDQDHIYIRPYIKGLTGAEPIMPASSYVFNIQLFPFGRQIGDGLGVYHLAGVEGKHRVPKGGIGTVKASGNYGLTLRDKWLAKNGELEPYTGTTFNDVIYFGDLNTGEKILEEDSSGNLMFLHFDGSTVNLFTPGLQRSTILAGITRDSILQIARSFGYGVYEMDMPVSMLDKMEIGFVVGSALGITRIESMTCQGERLEFNARSGTPCSQAFDRISSQLIQLKKGENPSFPSNWVKLVEC